MIHDVVVIGAGIGGLTCAAKLAKNGLEVLVLEKNPHIGGTSFIFKRDEYYFPMGPLSFSFPGRVNAFFYELYAATGLFLGGVPTAMHTAALAADLILETRS